MLELLGIKDSEMRPTASSDPKAPNAANYDEAKASQYRNLPDPLTLKNGGKVTTAKAWWSERRPEIVADYEREVLGRAPANLPKVTWQVVSRTEETVGDTPVLTRRLAGHVDNSIDPQITVTIDAVLTTPAHATGPVPVIMELAFGREYEGYLKKEPQVTWSGPGGLRPGDGGTPWQQQVLARGWGYAILNPASFQADDGAGLTAGIIGLMNKGQPRSPDDWGAMRAWSWGASRLLDYLETDPTVDAKHVGLMGHSRFGKTALVAMAYDSRFAVLYSSSSGEGGAKLYRHIYGEPLPNAASSTEYQWFGGNFLKYAGLLTPGDLPVDNHELIALCAPRPVFIGAGRSAGDGYADPRGDGWADARGMFLAEVAAGPVYQLLGKKGLGTTEYPPIETALVSGDLGFRQHSGGHTPAPNWPAFLEFASRYLSTHNDKARTLDAVIRDMDAAAHRFHTAQADFEFDTVQTEPVPDRTVQKGTIYFERKSTAAQMSAHIQEVNSKPAHKIYVYAGGAFKLFENPPDQVTTLTRLTQYESWFMLGFGASAEELAAKWSMKYLSSESIDGVTTDKLELIPKDASVRKNLSSVTAWIDSSRDVSVRIVFNESSGITLTRTHTRVKVNQPLPSNAFVLDTDSRTTYIAR